MLPPKWSHSDYQEQTADCPEELQLDLMSHLFVYLLGVLECLFVFDTDFLSLVCKNSDVNKKDDIQL